MRLGTTVITALGKSITIQSGSDIPVSLGSSQNFNQQGTGK